MNNRTRAALSAALMAVLGAVSAQAAEQGFYVEADAGSTSFDLDKGELDEWAGITDEQTSLDSSDMSFSLAAGYRFSRYFAVEALYVDLGEARYTVEDEGIAVGLGLKSRGPAVALAGVWPINPIWSLEGRIGAYFGKSSLSASVSDGAEAVEVGVASKSVSGVMLDAGIVAAFGGHWAVRLGYTHFDKAVAMSNEDLGIDMDAGADRFLLGIRYSF